MLLDGGQERALAEDEEEAERLGEMGERRGEAGPKGSIRELPTTQIQGMKRAGSWGWRQRGPEFWL